MIAGFFASSLSLSVFVPTLSFLFLLSLLPRYSVVSFPFFRRRQAEEEKG